MRARQGVILCAGGFVMNEDMLRKYAPMLTAGTEPIGNPGDTGSGILMGMSVGGAAINMHEGFISLPYYPPASMTKGIVINDKGQRFINEDVYHGRLGAFVLRQQSERIYFIVTVEQYGDYERVSYLGAQVAGTGETVAGAGAGTGPAPGHPATDPRRLQRGLRKRRRHPCATKPQNGWNRWNHRWWHWISRPGAAPSCPISPWVAWTPCPPAR